MKEKEMGVSFILTMQLTPPTNFPPILRLKEKPGDNSECEAVYTSVIHIHCTLQTK